MSNPRSLLCLQMKFKQRKNIHKRTLSSCLSSVRSSLEPHRHVLVYKYIYLLYDERSRRVRGSHGAPLHSKSVLNCVAETHGKKKTKKEMKTKQFRAISIKINIYKSRAPWTRSLDKAWVAHAPRQPGLTGPAVGGASEAKITNLNMKSYK